jgi:hypothetical protein
VQGRSTEEGALSAGQVEGRLKRQPKAGWRSPFGILAISASFLRSANSTKAIIYSILAFILQLVVGFGPLGIGITLLFQGQLLAALLVPIALYVMYGIYTAFWPIIAVLIFFGIWREEGFVTAVFATLVFMTFTFLLFSGPEWLLRKANEASLRAETYARMSEPGDSSNENQ